MRKFAIKIVSRQNSVNQFGIQIHILGVLFDVLGVLVGVLVLFGVPGVFLASLVFLLAYLVFGGLFGVHYIFLV